MAGYPVIDPAGVRIYDEEGGYIDYAFGDTVPLSKLISRRYNWLVNRGYLSEVETDDWGTASWGEITGTLSAQTDLQSALDAKLNLTGGTLTGSLTLAGTAGAKNLSMSAGYASLGSVSIGKSGAGYGTIGYNYRTSASNNTYLYDSNDVAAMIDFVNGGLTFKTGASGVAGNTITYTDRFSVNGSGDAAIGRNLSVAGTTILSGSVTLNGANFTHSVTGSATHNVTGTQYGGINIGAGAGYTASLVFRTAASQRWLVFKDESAESGSNAGSNFMIRNYSDAGAYISTPLTITRSTGLTTLTSLTVSGQTTLTGNVISNVSIVKASAAFQMASSSGAATIYFDRPAGNYGQLQFRSGSSAAGLRWNVLVNSTAESGSNAGSDFAIQAISDAGSLLSTPISITRSTGDIVLASTTDSSSSTTGAIKTAGGMGIAKKLYVGTDLNVAGTIEASDVRAISQVMGAF